jgi:hypothetical protein
MFQKLFSSIRAFPHIKEALSENGRGSFSRYACAFILINATAWVWYMIFKTHVLPDFSSLSLYVPATLATLYGSNQVKNVVTAWKGGKPDDDGSKPGDNDDSKKTLDNGDKQQYT